MIEVMIMQYAKLTTPTREAFISVEPTGWGLPYQQLFDQTNASGHEVFLIESHNNFNNLYQSASEARHKQRGWWAQIFRDIVREGEKGTDDKGRLNVSYVSHAGTQFERNHDLWAPKNGYWVPTNDGIFVPETLVPFETVSNRNEAIRRLETEGIPKEQVSYFYRLDNYKGDERFAGRDFDPGFPDLGRFRVYLDGLPSSRGDDWVASLPAYGRPKILMEVKAIPQEAEAK